MCEEKGVRTFHTKFKTKTKFVIDLLNKKKTKKKKI